ncbi:MAG: tellurite resistance TerB family protein [Winogradskyella sp.]|jgi:mRNA-degrading endonuclease RelE of RelBE toxin-antitoxin system
MNKELLIHLGHVFYAIAKADDNLSFEEYVKLSQSLKKRWHHLTEAERELIKNQFNTLQNENISAEDSFSVFIEFLHQNPKFFTEELKKLVLKTCNDIAYAFAKINKSELNFMAKLSLEFKKLQE